jgi:hypothetical protein
VLSGGEFGGTLRLSSAELGVDLNQRSLAGDGIRVSRDLLLEQATCTGGILLTGTSVGGTLNCRSARVSRHIVRAAPERSFCVASVCRYSPLDHTCSHGSGVHAVASDERHERRWPE